MGSPGPRSAGGSAARLQGVGARPGRPWRGRQLLYANWRELGHVLVAGLAGGGAEVVLTSLVAALTARCRPEELRLWTIASRRTLPDQLAGLPHQRAGFVDPDDEAAVEAMLADARAELRRRMREEHRDPDRPTVVLVACELAQRSADAVDTGRGVDAGLDPGGQAVDLFGTPLTARVDGPASNGKGTGHHPTARPGNGPADRASEQPANQDSASTVPDTARTLVEVRC